jgi:Mce-associated membrane protein
VRVQTDAASEPDAAEVQTTEPVEGEANEPEDAENTVGAEDTELAEAAISDEADAEDEAEAAISDEADAEDEAQEGKPAKAKLRISWPQVVAYGLLPGLALVLAAAGGFLKWQDSSARAAQLARIESVAAAKDSTIALLSYKSDTVEKDLEAAKNRMTGAFKESYSQLINDVVIPGAKKGHISTTASVPAAASVSATANHAVTLLFVNQTAVVDKDPPTDTVSSVRVTLDKVAGRWLISGFDPV